MTTVSNLLAQSIQANSRNVLEVAPRYQGTYNAVTNYPNLQTSGVVPTDGSYWIVSKGATLSTPLGPITSVVRDDRISFINGKWVRSVNTKVDSGDVTYQSNSQYTDVEEALDELLYKAPVVTLQLPAAYPKGTSVSTLDISFTTNGHMTHRKLSIGGSVVVDLGPGGTGTYTYGPATAKPAELVLKADTPVSLEVIDVRNAKVTAVAVVAFIDVLYYGHSKVVPPAEGTALNAWAKALTAVQKSTLVTDLQVTAADAGEYFYYVLPSSMNVTPKFTANGFTGGFSRVVSNVGIDGGTGTYINYDIWKTNHHSLGAFILEVTS